MIGAIRVVKEPSPESPVFSALAGREAHGPTFAVGSGRRFSHAGSRDAVVVCGRGPGRGVRGGLVDSRADATEQGILALAMTDNIHSARTDPMSASHERHTGQDAERRPGQGGREGLAGRLLRGVGTHNLSLLIALACLVAIFGGMRSDVFFSARNIGNIGQGMAILGILATAQTIVIVSGGLDISVGAVVGLSTVGIALGVQQTGSATLGILFGLVIGAIAGLVNGLIVTVGGVNAVIATLGTMAAFRGVAFIMSDGQSISIFLPVFRQIGSGSFLGLQITIEILVVVVAIFFVLMRYTIVGRNIYAIGGNPTAARLAGLNNAGYQIGVYILSGVAAGLGGLLLAARTGIRATDLRLGRSGAAGNHSGGAWRLRADWRKRHDRRRRSRRHHPWRAEQRDDSDQRADILSDGRPWTAADPCGAGCGAAGETVRLNAPIRAHFSVLTDQSWLFNI